MRQSARVYRAILIVCGAFLIGLAAYFVVTGFQFFT
jgi:phage shock protein PspC (stress-responsive transcriptional regulator)